MGDRSRFLSSTGLRLLLRLMSVVAALVVLSISSRAAAAPLAAIPMCGERNESVAAPPIFRSFDTSTLEAGPCQAPLELGIASSAPLTPERVVVPQTPERVLPFAALRLARSEARRLSIPVATYMVERPGFIGTLLRPPQS